MAVPLFVPIDIRRRHLRRRTTLDQLSESEIRKHCGLPSYCVRDLIDLYEPIDGTISTKVPLDTKLLLFLSQLRSGSFQWVVGSNCGVTQPCASTIISACCDQTLTFARDVIKIPTLVQERIKIKQDFFNIARIPNILGVLDGTHVPIIAPHQNEPAYVNRKLYHSINCQVLASRDYQIFDIVAKWPGSVHDSYIWNNSRIKERLYADEFGRGIFIADSGYAREDRLTVPFRSTTIDQEEINFNRRFKETRSTVERAIGNWKCRFRSMDKTGGFSCYSPAKVCKLIVSSVTIHNILTNRQVPLLEEDIYHRDNFIIPDLD